ncbi:MAG: carboxypeptidase-like regulatory domain-containing protein, partial [Solirubrobacteraceae bacterium]|nr:carboxypeptidase-like regulatory domain-containing protein [Solirubrobacteraceae bacterium]
MRAKAIGYLALCIVLLPALAAAQQTGTIVGKVLDTGGLVLPGVTVEAKSNVLPTPRTTVTGGAGEFRMPALPPGTYTVEFTLSGMATVTRQVEVQLGQDTNV